MNATVFDIKKNVFQISVDQLSQRLPADGFFWLDIDSASVEELKSVATALHLSEAMSAWLPRFGQRARLEIDKDLTRISTWGVGASGQIIEVHIIHTQSWLLTVHCGCGSAMDRARDKSRRVLDTLGSQPVWGLRLFIIMTELMAGFDSLMEHVDQLLYALEEQIIIQTPTKTQIEQLMRLRKQMWSLHRIWEPQQWLAKQFSLFFKVMPGLSGRADTVSEYAERLSDLNDRITDLRQRATEAMESYGTSVSNRQSQIINRLTIISAVFLPLTFLTGYLGMNFQWMIDHMHSLEIFLFLGVGLFVVNIVATLLFFRSRGWLGEKEAGKPESAAAAPTVADSQATDAKKSITIGCPPAQQG